MQCQSELNPAATSSESYKLCTQELEDGFPRHRKGRFNSRFWDSLEQDSAGSVLRQLIQQQGATRLELRRELESRARASQASLGDDIQTLRGRLAELEVTLQRERPSVEKPSSSGQPTTSQSVGEPRNSISWAPQLVRHVTGFEGG